ncbi:DUF3365 domain-containing protein [Desulfuromonas thiophila]|uniref:c-type heme family protein n=1 Tax=Desulfuromonas thiophila TaxID=57664 RepID=UPI0029F49EDB|nr:DUF3365 domain-containing protein [Desulfuromonas thiophila]
MRWISQLKLRTRLNLILLSALTGLFMLVALLGYRDQQAQVRELALERARGIARQIIETRNYMAAVVGDEPARNPALTPQVVATGVARRLTADSDYVVRQISLRYRNPANLPDAYEHQRLQQMANQPQAEDYRVVSEGGQPVLRYLHRMDAEASCLRCHGDYAAAPDYIQRRFGPQHPSYNYQAGEMIGAISVLVPMAWLEQGIAANLQRDLFYRLIILLVIFFALGTLLRKFVLRPVLLASTAMQRVSRTGDLSTRLDLPAAQDEIGALLAAFNDMMAALQRSDLQLRESEERYRNLIEAAQAGIVTFLADGKIVISNRMAEEFFGISRRELLGRSVFDFLDDRTGLKQKIAQTVEPGGLDDRIETRLDRIRNANGQPLDVEVRLLLASSADRVPLYTLLLTRAGGNCALLADETAPDTP